MKNRIMGIGYEFESSAPHAHSYAPHAHSY